MADSLRCLIRVDASRAIGTGHVWRCLVLAGQLRAMGIDVHFVCRALDGSLIQEIEAGGYVVHQLCAPQPTRIQATARDHSHWLEVSPHEDARETNGVLAQVRPHLLVVDHYAIGESWQAMIKGEWEGRLIVLDDLADRRHQADVLIEQSYHLGGEARYHNLVPPQCVTFCGPQFVFLNESIVRGFRHPVPSRSAMPQRLLVFFGGVDQSNQTGKAIEALRGISLSSLHVDVVLGRSHPAIDYVTQQAAGLQGAELHIAPVNFAELLCSADLCVGAGGVNAWERMFLQIPSIAVAIADNQVATLNDASCAGLVHYLGRDKEVSAKDLGEAINCLLQDPSARFRMQDAMQSLMRDRYDQRAMVSGRLLEAMLNGY